MSTNCASATFNFPGPEILIFLRLMWLMAYLRSAGGAVLRRGEGARRPQT